MRFQTSNWVHCPAQPTRSYAELAASRPLRYRLVAPSSSAPPRDAETNPRESSTGGAATFQEFRHVPVVRRGFLQAHSRPTCRLPTANEQESRALAGSGLIDQGGSRCGRLSGSAPTSSTGSGVGCDTEKPATAVPGQSLVHPGASRGGPGKRVSYARFGEQRGLRFGRRSEHAFLSRMSPPAHRRNTDQPLTRSHTTDRPNGKTIPIISRAGLPVLRSRPERSRSGVRLSAVWPALGHVVGSQELS